ncbi:MAG: hypothetical protein J7623_08090 [Chitinophaga sp.]|uniref:RNA ligase family protein n=1 Tax=Chitinophaga sp. TaxID=1869181 RepID=UPI001B2246D5|nr:RNA ligase family protein [Chitinophaga sp.]MBO9728581.1 hypothetical protein [Chitinophaga sp.]
MSEHSAYEKMPKNSKGLTLSEKELNSLYKLKWVVTEKIHGANFSFVYDHQQLRYAKRKEYLQWGDDFFGFQQVVADLEGRVLSLFEQLQQDMPAYRYILYGELFGGEYPHPDVPPDEQVQAIQTGVYYSPTIRFCAFDIALYPEDADSKIYLDYDTAITYFERFNIFYAKPLFIGKWNDALNFDIHLPSTIPALLHLPEITPNVMEGVVIKPFHHSTVVLSSRPVIKHKNPAFDEEEKFHEAEKWSFIPNVHSRAEELSFLVTAISTYITANRLNSALSKTGRLDTNNEKRLKEIKEEFANDVYADFNIDNGNMLAELDDAQTQWIRDRIMAQVTAFIHHSLPETNK